MNRGKDPMRKHYSRSQTSAIVRAIVVRRMIAVFLLLVLIVPSAQLVNAAKAKSQPKRVINLVYDDSGSMIANWDDEKQEFVEYFDTWCQAKYALEVFAGMLGENDTMNVFYMSDFQDSKDGKARLPLSGKNGAKTNVAKVHDTVTTDGETPFNAVEAAGKALAGEKADEKWLVILTDGSFQKKNGDPEDQDRINKFFNNKSDDINVMFLGMGSYAGTIDANPGKHIYSEKAENTDMILQKLTDIGKQVFNRDRLEVKDNKITFDIPMKELIVFAQGKDVSIKGIKSSGGKTVKSTSEPVTVQYSTKATNSNYFDNDKVKKTIDKSLKGSMATFDTRFAEGDYTIDVTGAKTVEVYYQPDVDIVASLMKGDEEVTDAATLEAGEYTVNFNLVKGGTTEIIKDSKLLGGDITYEAVVNNNGNKIEGVKNGDTVTLEEGSLSIDATAYYLGYHTVNTHLDFEIFKDKDVEFTAAGEEYVHKLTSKGFENDQPTQIAAKLDGSTPTAEQWELMDVPVVTDKKNEPELGSYKVEKSDTPGIYNVYPSIPEDGKLEGKVYSDRQVRITYNGQAGEEVWAGSGEATVKISDERSFLEKHWDLIKLLIALAILLIIALGYMPGIKRRLPKSLQKRPIVKGSHPDEDPTTTHAKFEKDIWKSFIPYLPETGTARVARKQFNLLASKTRGRIVLTNAEALKSYDIKIHNKRLKDYKDKVEFGPSAVIEVNQQDEWKYTCRLNSGDRRQRGRSRGRGRR